MGRKKKEATLDDLIMTEDTTSETEVDETSEEETTETVIDDYFETPQLKKLLLVSP